MNANDILYGLPDQEHLDTSIEDVVRGLMDDACEGPGESFDAIADRLTWPIQVREFKRMSVANSAPYLARHVLEYALEYLDEKHSDPDDRYTEPTSAMRDAAQAFAQAIVSEYVSWACEATGKVIEVTREHAKAMLEES